jgi:tetraacyldisaccharide 4'-kinase
VGNLTAGGSGKTPFCIFLADLFLSKGKKVCIISRGYKRKSRSLVVAFDGYKPDVIENTGDELMMIIKRLGGYKGRFFVLADSKRVRAAEYAVNKFNPDIIILDDAYQHLAIKRDIDILIRDFGTNSIMDKILLPAGNLREPSFYSGRADILIDNYKFSEQINDDIEKPWVFKAQYVSIGFYDKNDEPIAEISGNNAVIFSGLAKNDSFFLYIKNIPGLNIREEISYTDHHYYNIKDINKLLSFNDGNVIYITTEKDFVKLRKYTEFVNNFQVYYLKIDLITDRNRIFNFINFK